MNYIQRAWLQVLRPVAYLVNDKLAKKSGLLGKIGRFYSFGPREFGYHPSSRFMAMMNNYFVTSMGMWLHKYSFIKYCLINIGHSPRITTPSPDPTEWSCCSECTPSTASSNTPLFLTAGKSKSTFDITQGHISPIPEGIHQIDPNQRPTIQNLRTLHRNQFLLPTRNYQETTRQTRRTRRTKIQTTPIRHQNQVRQTRIQIHRTPLQCHPPWCLNHYEQHSKNMHLSPNQSINHELTVQCNIIRLNSY